MRAARFKQAIARRFEAQRLAKPRVTVLQSDTHFGVDEKKPEELINQEAVGVVRILLDEAYAIYKTMCREEVRKKQRIRAKKKTSLIASLRHEYKTPPLRDRLPALTREEFKTLASLSAKSITEPRRVKHRNIWLERYFVFMRVKKIITPNYLSIVG